MKTTPKIAVVGLGYVGVSNAIILARHNRVVALDVDAGRVAAMNAGESPVLDAEASRMLAEGALHLRATTDAGEALSGADIVVVATPTNYDPVTNKFDTRSVESVIRDVEARAPNADVIIKSTIPIGFVRRMREETELSLMFSPEFLREGQAVHDNLHPSRIVVGDHGKAAKQFANLMLAGADATDVPVLFTGPDEAEAIKLFSNTYLAMRVAYFNELDSFAIERGMNAREIIEGVSFDPRIGRHYNNPSFGYGGYCLPKDTRQLLANFEGIPQTLISAIIASNRTRKDVIADAVMEANPRIVGVYRLAMKAGSDNHRSSSVLGIIRRLRERGVEILIFEPTLPGGPFGEADLQQAEGGDAENGGPAFGGARVVDDLAAFKRDADVIIANRQTDDLADCAAKVFTRDLFGKG